jgi:hypothetical protein
LEWIVERMPDSSAHNRGLDRNATKRAGLAPFLGRMVGQRPCSVNYGERICYTFARLFSIGQADMSATVISAAALEPTMRDPRRSRRRAS